MKWTKGQNWAENYRWKVKRRLVTGAGDSSVAAAFPSCWPLSSNKQRLETGTKWGRGQHVSTQGERWGQKQVTPGPVAVLQGHETEEPRQSRDDAQHPSSARQRQ